MAVFESPAAGSRFSSLGPSRRTALLARLSGGEDDRGGRGPILADGSTGSALEALAPGSGSRLALLPLEAPELVEGLHRAYFEAGSELVETATFQASQAGIASWAAEGLPLDGAVCHDSAKIAYRVNLEAARAARRAADASQASTGRWRFVAGSMGPGDRTPSLGAATWGELKASYLPQARGLADGGCDLAIVETCQDPLQIKAALAALADPEGGRGLPAVVSATVDARGRLLVGTSIAALVAIVAPLRPLALGLNCSGGPGELEPSLAELARISPLPISFMPNAGLPAMLEDKPVWPLSPAVFGPLVAAMAERHGVALVGGCCGTKPGHMAALAAALGKGYAIPKRPELGPGLASLYEARPMGRGLFRIGDGGEGSGGACAAAIASYVASGDFDGAAAQAVTQEDEGADALNLHLAFPGRDEAGDMEALVARLGGMARAALCLDSSDPEVLVRALPLVGGRPLINFASLEDPARARRVLGLAKDFGAAVICRAADSGGQGKTAKDRARICRALYELAVGEIGLGPESLLFDPLALPLAEGPLGAGAQSLAAISLIKEACPGSLTVLRLGPVARGLPEALRSGLRAVFLGLALEEGLDAAILDCGGIPDPALLAPGLAGAAKALILGRGEGGRDPLAALLALGEGAGSGPS